MTQALVASGSALSIVHSPAGAGLPARDPVVLARARFTPLDRVGAGHGWGQSPVMAVLASNAGADSIGSFDERAATPALDEPAGSQA